LGKDFFIEKVFVQDIFKATVSQNQDRVDSDESNSDNENDIDIYMLDHSFAQTDAKKSRRLAPFT
jgi:hypothetical protein